MKQFTLLACAALLAVSCKPPEESRYKAIIGAVLIDPGSPLVSRSVLVVAGYRIRATGEQANVPIPAGADKIDGSGKFLVPAPVPIPDDLPRANTLAEVFSQVESGVIAIDGMIADTEDIDASFLHKLRDLKIVFIPRLASLPESEAAARARRNTKKLADAGALIAAGTPNDWSILRQIGLTPEQVLAAATTNAARAAKLEGEAGALRAGYRADVLLLKANPLEDPANLTQIETAIAGGEWTK